MVSQGIHAQLSFRASPSGALGARQNDKIGAVRAIYQILKSRLRFREGGERPLASRPRKSTPVWKGEEKQLYNVLAAVTITL